MLSVQTLNAVETTQCYGAHIYLGICVSLSFTHTMQIHKVKTKIRVFYPPSWTTVLGDELTVLLCFFIMSGHETCSENPSPDWSLQHSAKRSHTHEVGKKTCLTSPDLTCKFSFTVYGDIKELLLERAHLQRGATSETQTIPFSHEDQQNSIRLSTVHNWKSHNIHTPRCTKKTLKKHKFPWRCQVPLSEWHYLK